MTAATDYPKRSGWVWVIGPYQALHIDERDARRLLAMGLVNSHPNAGRDGLPYDALRPEPGVTMGQVGKARRNGGA